MLRSLSLALLLASGACGFNISTGSSIDATTGDGSNGSDADMDIDAPDSQIDAMPDSPPVPMGWSTPMSLGITGDDPTLTGDLLQIWFEQNGDIYHASRQSIFVGFGTATKVGELSMQGMAETTPEVATNGLSITFSRLVGNNNDLFIATWDSVGTHWMPPVPLTDLNTADHEQAATISDDRLMLAMTRNSAAAASHILISTRTTAAQPWGTPALVTELNSTQHDGSVFLSGDKLTVCFDSQRASLQNDIYCATRTSATAPFNAPAVVDGINSSQSDQDPWLSPNGKVMVFWSDRDGAGKLFYSLHP